MLVGSPPPVIRRANDYRTSGASEGVIVVSAVIKNGGTNRNDLRGVGVRVVPAAAGIRVIIFTNNGGDIFMVKRESGERIVVKPRIALLRSSFVVFIRIFRNGRQSWRRTDGCEAL